MSSASPFGTDAAARTLQRSVASSLQRTLPALRFVGFWTAVVLPFVLLSFLATGLVARHPTVAVVLLAGNVLGLALGKDYKR